MGNIVPIVREFARLNTVDARGEFHVTFVDISGPVVEAAKSLDWAVQVITKDGGKVLDAQFGTLQNGEFREEQRRRVPLFQGGFRRMAAYLHP